MGVLSTTTSSVIQEPVPHIETCITCHPASSLHGVTTHQSNCSACHAGSPGPGNVKPDKCVVCHPSSSPGVCNLINLPTPVLHGANCLTCHVDCDSNITNNHMSSCVVCHPTDFSSTNSLRIHSRSGHNTCSSCHPNGTPGKNVTADKCSACHPLSGTGDCKIVDVHAQLVTQSCLDCHKSCSGGAPITTTTSTISNTTTSTGGGSTTTSIGGGSTTTSSGGGTTTSIPGGSTTTTASAPSGHTDQCLTCHYVNDLHAQTAHNNCTYCHTGTPPQAGNVDDGKCVTCHPTGNPGKCNLVAFHGSTCITCHTPAMCAPSTTTTAGPGSSTTSTAISTTGHISKCLTCHEVSDLHAQTAHNNCTYCHTGTPPQAGNVDEGKCVTCHPTGNPGKCNLVAFHGSTCITCHTPAMCAPSTTTTIAGSTTTTTGSGSSTTTSASAPSGHNALCLTCHEVSDIHAKPAHNNCTYCHTGTPATAGNADVGKCAGCHPTGKPGTCNLVAFHGSSCNTCHTPAMCAPSTTTIIGSTTTTTGAGSSTTTVLPPRDHFSICLTCHVSSDLHDHPGHQTCASCHAGTPAKGNVEAEKCIVCHPLGAAGKCNLVNNHGSSCNTCHTTCSGGVTTTTIPNQSTSTTTAPPAYGHIDDCTGCHTVSDLHARQGHGDCSQCHDGTPQAGNVSPGNCVKCHPLGDAGKCNLIINHGGSCLTCHSNCSGGITTTTTIPNPPPSCSLTVDPESVRSGFLIPLFARIKIQTDGGAFDETSAISIQGFRYIRTTLITPTSIEVLAIVPPQFLIGKSNKIVTVLTGTQICTGTLAIR